MSLNLYKSKLPRSSRPKRKSKSQLFIESVVMIFIGLNLILFLNSIPDRIVWSTFVDQTWLNLAEGFNKLFQALIQIGAATSVLFLILFSLFLLLGGVIRLLRIMIQFRQSSRRYKR